MNLTEQDPILSRNHLSNVGSIAQLDFPVAKATGFVAHWKDRYRHTHTHTKKYSWLRFILKPWETIRPMIGLEKAFPIDVSADDRPEVSLAEKKTDRLR